MLVLSRKCGDAVAMGESAGGEHMVKVTVLEICGCRVKLGFEAGHDVPVHRWEVWQRIRSENGAAAPPSVRAKEETDRWEGDGGRAPAAQAPRAVRGD